MDDHSSNVIKCKAAFLYISIAENLLYRPDTNYSLPVWRSDPTKYTPDLFAYP